MTFLIHVYLLADLSLVFITLYNSQFSICSNLIHSMPFANSSTDFPGPRIVYNNISNILLPRFLSEIDCQMFCWLALIKLSACRPSTLSTSVL